MRVIFAHYLLVKQKLPKIGSSDMAARDPVDRGDRQAEAIGLVLNGKLQWSVDVALRTRGRGARPVSSLT